MAGSTGRVRIEGLKELLRACSRMDKDLGTDLVWELQEAADPARKVAEEYILRGGGGFAAMENMPRTPFYADMRIGVSRGQGEVYIAPAWHRGTGAGTPRPNLAVSFHRRMRGAVDDKGDELEDRLGKWLDTLADEWGSHLAA